MDTAKRAFIERLLDVLGARKRHVWGVALGFTNNRVHRLFVETEPLPSTEELAIIGEAENLNLNWLVYGIGPKYRVTTFQGPLEFNAAVQDVLQERWGHVFIVVSQSRCALLTLRTKNVLYKDRDVGIKQMMCLTGPGSAKLQSSVSIGQFLEFPTNRFDELEAGDLGIYFLFGDARTDGYLDDLEKREAESLLGNMPLPAPYDEIDLSCLINCYNKIQSLMKNTGQQLTKKKITELTWVTYQAEMME